VNEYGKTAMRHWETYRPTALAALENPTQFFEDLGKQVAEEIAALWPDLAKPQPGEDPTDFQAAMGRNRMAQLQAREKVMAELVFLPAEPGLEDAELPRDSA
jgi:hypothetical protein